MLQGCFPVLPKFLEKNILPSVSKLGRGFSNIIMTLNTHVIALRMEEKNTLERFEVHAVSFDLNPTEHLCEQLKATVMRYIILG